MTLSTPLGPKSPVVSLQTTLFGAKLNVITSSYLLAGNGPVGGTATLIVRDCKLDWINPKSTAAVPPAKFRGAPSKVALYGIFPIDGLR